MNDTLEMISPHNKSNYSSNLSRQKQPATIPYSSLKSILNVDTRKRRALRERQKADDVQHNASEKLFPPLNPLPKLNFAESSKLWNILQCRELKSKRVDDFLPRHPSITTDMREVLIDWLIEVILFSVWFFFCLNNN